jgi:hypothetical protein
MESDAIEKAREYAAQHQLCLAERLGFGVHGIIFVAEHTLSVGKTAVKAHHSITPYFRERAAYQRLLEANVSDLLGFHVPHLVQFDDALRVIEMTIVTRPFVLDFAGAYLDERPDFPEDKWAEWEIEKRDLFENRWSTVQSILAALEEFDIYMVDVSPSNIAFSD